MVVDQACEQEFFETEEVSRNKVTFLKKSAATNKQKDPMEKTWCLVSRWYS